MSRVNLQELEDLPWFPPVMRDAGTAFLAFVQRKSGHAAMLAPLVAEVAKRTGRTHVIDLACGGSGPAVPIVEALHAQGMPLTWELPDLHPNRDAMNFTVAESQGRVTANLEPMDATALPPGRRGLRTMFNAFHHLPDEAALAVMRNAQKDGEPLLIVELVSQEIPPLIGILMGWLTFTLSLPFLRPFKWAWIPLTVIPAIPLFVVWDGFASWMRMRSEAELEALTKQAAQPGWRWHIGKLRLGSAPAHATWMWGAPE